MIFSRNANRKAAELERQLAAVREISQALESKTNIDEIVKVSLETAVSTLDGQAGSILLCDSERKNLIFKYVVGPKAAELTDHVMPSNEGIAGQVFQSGEPNMSGEVRADQNFSDKIDHELKWQTRTMLTVPLKTLGGRTLGVMQVLNKKSGEFDEGDLDLLTVIAVQSASIINTARLYEAAKLATVVKAMGDIAHDIKNMLTPVVSGAMTLDGVLQGTFRDLDTVMASASGDEGRRLASEVEKVTADLRRFYPEAVRMLIEHSGVVQERVRQLADCVSGQITKPNFEETPISYVVDRVMRTLDDLAGKRGVRLKVEDLSGIPPFPLDRSKMYSAFYNLVDNALSATDIGGSITISGRVRPLGGKDHACIVVADTGKGMPGNVRAKLFTDDAISTTEGGTGLGTRIVKDVVDAHGGKVTCDSVLGQGTTFTMWFPLRR